MNKIIFILLLLIVIPVTAYSQEPTEEEKSKSTEEEQAEQAEPPIEEQGFINYGPIAISIGYKIKKDEKYIIYKIMNNKNQSIHSIFGWIFLIEKDETERITKKVLANNPNAGGILISKHPHKPSELGTWKFTLKQKSSSQNVQYMLRVNNRSIFYAPF